MSKHSTTWLAWSMWAASMPLFVAGMVLTGLYASEPRTDGRGSPVADLLWPILYALAVALIPVTVGIAILKYRLYEIDFIIRRTLIYGLLTGILAVLYFGSVIALETLLRPFTGQGHNDLVVVASTPLIAALFTPLRMRIQRFIERRFYRRRYDVAKALEDFSRAARDEVDLDTLADRLVQVVEEIMRPIHISLGLHEPPRKG